MLLERVAKDGGGGGGEEGKEEDKGMVRQKYRSSFLGPTASGDSPDSRQPRIQGRWPDDVAERQLRRCERPIIIIGDRRPFVSRKAV